MIIHLKTWGELACFTRPEMKVERVSYPVITPSAARGLLESILYKPQFRWRVRRVAVKRAIRFLSFRRNEVKKTLPEASAKRWMRGAPVEPFFAEDEHTPPTRSPCRTWSTSSKRPCILRRWPTCLAENHHVRTNQTARTAS